MEPLADTTRINRLRLRGPAGVRQSLLAQLACADWPAPPGQSWVLVRRVTVRGNARQLPAELVAETRKLASGDGEQDNVVRFASFTDLLAALTGDLVAGTASQRWYWRQWSHLFPLRRGEAISRLMTEHHQHLNGVCSRLAASGRLEAVWQTLEPADARQVTTALAHGAGVNLTDPITDTNKTGGHVGALPAATVARWRPVIRLFKPEDARFRLCLILVGLENQAVALRQAPAVILQRVQQQLSPASHEPAPVAREGSRQTGSNDAPSRPLTDPATLNQPAEVRARPNQGEPPTDSTNLSSGGHSQPTDAQSQPTARGMYGDPGIQHHHPSNATREVLNVAGEAAGHPFARLTSGHDASYAAVDPRNEPAQFRTRMGGALYLLNVLNRPQLQRIMEAEWKTLPSGWAWLYRLAETLDLDPTDPLSDFLAEQLGLASPGELATLPPLPRKDEILTLVWQWYGEELWRPDLLQIPAQLNHTPSHLDLTLSEKYVQLELRLAGLDINPGWLPWLGRVVNFHFEHDPDQRGHPS